MVTDAQVRLLRQKRMEKKTQEAAAAAAGMSVRSARKWQTGALPSETKRPRTWRTHADAFAEVWQSELVPLLEADKDGVLEATTLLAMLEERHPGRFALGQLRTLQRRLRDWRAVHGPAKEVYFEQVAVPGHQASIDFTHASDLGVTIAGRPFRHLLFVFALAFSGWTWVRLASGETFEALVEGLQGALWALGGLPAEIRSDNLSAATHELRQTGGRSLTKRFRAVLDHYGLRSSRIQPGESHENGVAEQAHRRVKSALAQALLLRGSSDFATVEEYERFVVDVVERTRNRGIDARLAEERGHLKPLPSAPVPNYSVWHVRVRKWSTIRICKRTYSVPSRLIGHEVNVRLYADVVEVSFAGTLVETMPRLHGSDEHRIDYRHVIWSLVRKPGAFARYRFREDLFPSLTFRRAYDALRAGRGDRADVDYVRILHLAASTMESRVEAALARLLDEGVSVDYAAVKAVASPEAPAVPTVAIAPPDLAAYDSLIAGGAA
jgi:transposase InsO family protein